MHPANQRPGKPDKLSQGAYNQTSYPKSQRENTLDKRGLHNPQRTTTGGARTGGTQGHRTEGRAYELPMLQEARKQA